MNSYKYAARWVVVLVALALLSVEAQFRGGGRSRRDYEIRDPERIKEQEIMEKALNPEFREDVFTFARLKFQADRDYRFGGGRTGFTAAGVHWFQLVSQSMTP